MDMKTFARIDAGRVVEIILQRLYDADAPAPPDPNNVPAGWPTFKAGEAEPIDVRYSPEIVAALVDITGLQVGIGDMYDNGAFSPYVPRAPSPAEILARNTVARNGLLELAAQRIAPLQDAVDLEMATADDTTKLTAWKRYRVEVNRIDLTLQLPAWPAEPA
jgi:hypothetical protein